MISFYTHTYALVEDKDCKRLFAFGLTAEERPVIAMITRWTTTIDIKVRADLSKLPPFLQRGVLDDEKARINDIILHPEGDDSTNGGIELVSHEFVDLQYFHQWVPGKTKFHRLSVCFDNYVQFELVQRALRQKKFSIADCLDREERFLLDYKLKPTQWLTIAEGGFEMTPFGNESSRSPLEITVQASMLKPSSEEWKVPRALLANIDIETFSSMFKKGRFPNSQNVDDIIYAVSYTLSYSDSKEILRKLCIVVANNDIGQVRVPGVEVIQVEDEFDLLQELAKLINETDPDAFITYNGLRFDFKYIRERAEHIYDGFPQIGRVKTSARSEKFIINRWKGAGNRYHEYHYPQAYGRVNVDAYVVAGRVKLDEIGHNRGAFRQNPKDTPKDEGPKSHKLDDVGEYFCGENKIGLSYEEQFALYAKVANVDNQESRNAIDGLNRIVEYCVQDSVLCSKVFYEMKTWVEVRESACIMFQDMTDIFTTGQMRKYKAQLVRQAREDGYYLMPAKQPASFKLKGGHVEIPKPGLRQKVATVDFSGMYPSIMMGENICQSTYVPNLRGTDITPEEKKNFKRVVMEKEVGIPDLPADYEIPPDFRKEDFLGKRVNGQDIPWQEGQPLPSIYNRDYIMDLMSQEGYGKEYLEAFVNEICDIHGLPSLKYKGKTEELVAYFYDKKKRKGVVPRILERLKTTRKEFKNVIKRNNKAIDIIKKNTQLSLDDKERQIGELEVIVDIYDRRQGAIKVLMNSIYGIYGSPELDYGFMEGSAATTHFGRMFIHKVNDFLVSKRTTLQDGSIVGGCEIVYGDTDSSFFSFLVKPTFEMVIEGSRQMVGRKLQRQINDLRKQEGNEERVEELERDFTKTIDGNIAKLMTELREKIDGAPNPDTQENILLLEYANCIVDEINTTVLEDPIQVELEKVMNVLCLTKKKYVGQKIISEGKILDKPENLIRGIALARGDTLPFVKVVYKELIRMLFDGKSKKDIVEYYGGQIAELRAGRISRELLIMKKTLADTYASESAVLAVYSRYLHSIGKPAESGTKLEFLVVKGNGSVGSRYRPVQSCDYVARPASDGSPAKEAIDVEYYVEIARTPLEQFIAAL